MELSMYLNMCSAGRYMEISMYRNVCGVGRFMEISMYLDMCCAGKCSTGRFPEISMYRSMCSASFSFHLRSKEIMLFEVNFTKGSDFVAKFNFFFRNLASLTSLLTAPGKNFTEVADY